MKKRTSSRILAVLVLAVLCSACLIGAQKSDAANVQLQAAIHKETIEGDLDQAIRMYKEIVSKYSANHGVAGTALLHMGQAYEKLGNAEARKTYERVVREFADQKEIAAAASRMLGVLDSAGASAALIARAVSSTGDNAGQAFITADGRWMAMANKPSTGGDLVIRDMSNGSDRILQRGSCREIAKPCIFAENPVVSPDGRQVAYSWYDQEIDGQAQLRVIANENGASPRVLVKNPESGSWAVAWSADGKSILVHRRQQIERTWQLGWVSVADGSVKVLKSMGWRAEAGIKLSPDGRYIAYSAQSANPASENDRNVSADRFIYILATDGASETVLTKTAGFNDYPVWSPDGGAILFTSNRTGTFDLWSVAVRAGAPAGSPALVKRNVGGIQPIAVTRSGSFYYAETQSSGQQFSLAKIEALSSGRGVAESVVGLHPTWSPDGKSLAFTRPSPRIGENSYDLVVLSLETRQEKKYMRDGIAEGPHPWFNDGSILVTTAGPQERLDLKTGEFINIGAKIRAALGAADFIRGAASTISGSDNPIYLSARASNRNDGSLDRIVAIDPLTWKPRLVFKLPVPGSISDLGLSHDGHTLAMTVTKRGVGIPTALLARVGTDGSNYRELYSPFRLAGSGPGRIAWSRDGSEILFSMSPSDDTRYPLVRLMRVPAEGGRPEEVKGLKASYGSPWWGENPVFIAMSPSGSDFTFSAPPVNKQTMWVLDVSAALRSVR